MWIVFLLCFALAVCAFLFGNWHGRRQCSISAAPIIDRDAACPACGHRDGTLRFNALVRLIVHTCAVCQASWVEKTLLDTDGWLKAE
jgi:rubredoxin